MPDVPTHAKCVIIGAGIVGNCLAGHLAKLGWTDLVLLDKGPLPNPGGSTGHASNFIFPTDHNKEMAFLTVESQRQYTEYGVNGTCGGIEVAREPQRLEEFNRRMTSAKTYGIEAELLTPAEVKKLVPFVNEEIILGGYYTPSVSVVDSLQMGTLMREEAVEGMRRAGRQRGGGRLRHALHRRLRHGGVDVAGRAWWCHPPVRPARTRGASTRSSRSRGSDCTPRRSGRGASAW